MTPIPDDEIMPRAREAAIAAYGSRFGEMDGKWARSGSKDNWMVVVAAAQALRDAHRPLSELVPAHPRLQEARELLAGIWESDGREYAACDVLEGKYEHSAPMQAILAAFDRIERGAK